MMHGVPGQAGSFFGARAEGAMLAELGPGATLLLPGSWPHAVVTQQDSLVVGGNFLHALDLRCVCDSACLTRHATVFWKF